MKYNAKANAFQQINTVKRAARRDAPRTPAMKSSSSSAAVEFLSPSRNHPPPARDPHSLASAAAAEGRSAQNLSFRGGLSSVGPPQFVCYPVMGKVEVAAAAAAVAGAATYLAKRRDSPSSSPAASPSKEAAKRLHRLSQSHTQERASRDRARQLFHASAAAPAAPAAVTVRIRSLLGTLFSLIALLVGACACVAAVRGRTPHGDSVHLRPPPAALRAPACPEILSPGLTGASLPPRPPPPLSTSRSLA